MVHSLWLAFSLATLAVRGTAQKCPLTFDSRVPTSYTAADLDLSTSIFNNQYVKGHDLNFSKEVQLSPSDNVFDKKVNAQALIVSLSEKSIFWPDASNPAKAQKGVRRIELLTASNNGSDPSTVGIKTFHFSIMKDATHPLNISHEYMLAWMENGAYSNGQWNLRTGTLLDQKVPGGNPDTLMLFGTSKYYAAGTVADLMFQTKFTADTWHNFGVMMDFTKNTTQVYYSTGADPLKNVTAVIPNDVSGRGQFHTGLMKKPTNLGPKDNVLMDGTQESPIKESLRFGGIFMDDSTGGCVSTAP